MTARALSLAECYSEEEIRGFIKQVLDASIERVSENIIINATSKPDGRGSSGVSLSSPEDQEAFLRDCHAALELKRSKRAVGPTLTDLSNMMIRA